MADDKKCAHESCVCMVRGDDEYCSEICKEAGEQDLTEISCDCGHAGCS